MHPLSECLLSGLPSMAVAFSELLLLLLTVLLVDVLGSEAKKIGDNLGTSPNFYEEACLVSFGVR